MEHVPHSSDPKEYLAPNGFDAVQVAPVTEHAPGLCWPVTDLEAKSIKESGYDVSSQVIFSELGCCCSGFWCFRVQGRPGVSPPPVFATFQALELVSEAFVREVISPLLDAKDSAVASACLSSPRKAFKPPSPFPETFEVLGYQWWVKYQPVSAGLDTRSGTEAEFRPGQPLVFDVLRVEPVELSVLLPLVVAAGRWWPPAALWAFR